MNRQEEKDLAEALRKSGMKPRWIPRRIDEMKAAEPSGEVRPVLTTPLFVEEEGVRKPKVRSHKSK